MCARWIRRSNATTDMLNWLTADYGLSLNAARHLLGHVVHYDVGNVFAPAYTMACSVAKEWLPANFVRQNA